MSCFLQQRTDQAQINPRLLPSFLSHTVQQKAVQEPGNKAGFLMHTCSDKKLGRSLGTRLEHISVHMYVCMYVCMYGTCSTREFQIEFLCAY